MKLHRRRGRAIMMINQPELECYGNLGDPARPGLRVKADSESESESEPRVPVARTPDSDTVVDTSRALPRQQYTHW